MRVPPQEDPSADESAGFVHTSPSPMKALAPATPPAWNLPTACEGLLPGGMDERSDVKSSAVSPARLPLRDSVNVQGLIASCAAGFVYVSASGLAIVPSMLPVSESATPKEPNMPAPFGFGFAAGSASKESAKLGATPALEVWPVRLAPVTCAGRLK